MADSSKKQKRTPALARDERSRGARRGRKPGAPRTKEAILAAAETLFARVGFDAATTREISELSGENKALIHYHFASKEDLLGAVLDRHYGRLEAALVEAVAGASSVEDRLRKALDAYVDFLAEHHDFAKIIQREVAAGTNVDAIWERTLPSFLMVTRWLEEELPLPKSGPLSAPQVLLSFYAMAITYFVSPEVLAKLLGREPLSPSALAQRKAHLHHMMDLVLRDLPKTPPSRRARR